MTISFSSKKLQKSCSSRREMQALFGQQIAKKLQLRLTELAAADTLDDISRLPPVRCHELDQNRKGELAVDLVHPKRLIFVPDHDPIPQKSDGGLDWTQVTKLIVLEVVDYH